MRHNKKVLKSYKKIMQVVANDKSGIEGVTFSTSRKSASINKKQAREAIKVINRDLNKTIDQCKNNVGFWDMHCAKCGTLYGWQGKSSDCPGCPVCGGHHGFDAKSKKRDGE